MNVSFGSFTTRKFAPLITSHRFTFFYRKYSIYDASVDEWTSILKLAHMWDFIEVKELAIRGLEGLHDIPALQKVALYQKYEVDRNLLQAAYTALTVRDEPITVEEGRELGLETALLVAQARETARAPRRARSQVSLAGAELDALINNIFTLSSSDPAHAHAHVTNMSQTSTSGGTDTQTHTGSSSSNTAQGTSAMCSPSLSERSLNR